MNDYYVYVYIDPRNYEEFYYGKGTGSRKDAHLADTSDSAKAKRIAEIRKEGLTPTIRVIARGLSEPEALLVEKTLLWKLGKWTTNVATGHFADKFRPHNSMHRELSGFDFRNGCFYYNVGEGPHRNWDDYLKFKFISGGQGPEWRDSMLGFNPGDVFAARITKHGYVGVGQIMSRARMIKDVQINGNPLIGLPLVCQNMGDNSEDPDLSEYVCLVTWLKTVSRQEAKWQSGANLFAPRRHIRASLDNHPETLTFIEEEFGVKIRELIA